eukprot:Phypoly_transcript_06083.p1 GENE.Phypoly_transcript_06083~~Phypoly_transcript_06083.p1  ORF type:complete len:103 (-),score=12.70 Phypoly_transcript_06083:640-948(-)
MSGDTLAKYTQKPMLQTQGTIFFVVRNFGLLNVLHSFYLCICSQNWVEFALVVRYCKNNPVPVPPYLTNLRKRKEKIRKKERKSRPHLLLIRPVAVTCSKQQ